MLNQTISNATLMLQKSGISSDQLAQPISPVILVFVLLGAGYILISNLIIIISAISSKKKLSTVYLVVGLGLGILILGVMLLLFFMGIPDLIEMLGVLG